MNHVGKLLKKSIEESGYSISEVARGLDVSASTVFRWCDVPNLPVKHIISIHSKFPFINLKPLFESIEKKQGYPLPDNPYTRTAKDEVNTDPGIQISIDGDKYAGYAIPPDLANKVREYILDYQKQRQKGKK